MAKGYSKDLRVRAVSIVETGESAREAARLLNVGASTQGNRMNESTPGLRR